MRPEFDRALLEPGHLGQADACSSSRGHRQRGVHGDGAFVVLGAAGQRADAGVVVGAGGRAQLGECVPPARDAPG